VVEIAEPDILQTLGIVGEVPPVELAEAREPPARAGRQEQVVDAVAVEVADTVLAEGVDLDAVAAADMDVGRRVEDSALAASRGRLRALSPSSMIYSH
jgi:hypothetical protein